MTGYSTVNVGDWVVEVDREATSRMYAELVEGAPDCSCPHCEDWAAHRDEIYTAPVRAIFTTLGIDHRREADLDDLDPTAEPPLCGSWFNFIGRIVSGPAADRQRSATRLPDPSRITAEAEVIVAGNWDVMLPPFRAAFDADSPVATVFVRVTGHRMSPGA